MIGSAAAAAGAAGTVTALRRPTSRCPGMVGILRQFSSSTVASIARWTVTCGFMVIGFTSSERRYLSYSAVDSHEVGVLRELGDDFTHAHPLSMTCYRGYRHEALFGGGV
jgi:hypothetical protein